MKVLIRADQNKFIGGGHISRCRSLGLGLKERGHEVIMLCRSADSYLGNQLKTDGLEFIEMRKRTAEQLEQPNIESWLGSTHKEEIEDSREVLSGINNIDIIVVDHYALGLEWHAMARQYTKGIVAIDDLCCRQHDCDILIDQGWLEGKRAYASYTPEGCKLLLGPRYALLQEVFRAYRRTAKIRDGIPRKILIYFGSGYDYELTFEVCRLLAEPPCLARVLDIVVPNSYTRSGELKDLLESSELAYSIESQIPSLAEKILKADLGIGSTGSTTWERMCLYLPTVGVSLSRNQQMIGTRLGKNKLIKYAGDINEQSAEALASRIVQMAKKTTLRKESERVGSVVDGEGVSRVVEAMMQLHESRNYLQRSRSSSPEVFASHARRTQA